MYTPGSVLVCLVRDETSEVAGTGSSGGLALSTPELVFPLLGEAPTHDY